MWFIIGAALPLLLEPYTHMRMALLPDVQRAKGACSFMAITSFMHATVVALCCHACVLHVCCSVDLVTYGTRSPPFFFSFFLNLPPCPYKLGHYCGASFAAQTTQAHLARQTLT